MVNTAVIAIILIIIALLGGIAGLTFLILGLAMNNRKQWLPGAIIAGIALVIGIACIGFGIRNFLSRMEDNNELHNFMYNHKDYTPPDSLFSTITPVDTSFAKAVSGFIEDRKNDLVYIKVFPKKHLASLGITLEEVAKGMEDASIHKAICLVIKMDATFAGRMKLTLYNEDKRKLGLSEINISLRAGKRVKLNFPFKDDVPLSEIKFGKLTCN